MFYVVYFIYQVGAYKKGLLWTGCIHGDIAHQGVFFKNGELIANNKNLSECLTSYAFWLGVTAEDDQRQQ